MKIKNLKIGKDLLPGDKNGKTEKSEDATDFITETNRPYNGSDFFTSIYKRKNTLISVVFLFKLRKKLFPSQQFRLVYFR